MFQFNEETVYEPLEVLQATSLEQNDLKIVISAETVTSTRIPQAEGTNKCGYLTLSKTEALSLQQESDPQELQSSVTSIIINFLQLFSKHRTTNRTVDIYEAYELLYPNHFSTILNLQRF